MKENNTDLVVVETLSKQIFLEKEADGKLKIDKVLFEIMTRVDEFVPDMSTEKGRAEIKSFAYKIAQTKTGIDDLGKEAVEEWQRNVKAVNADRTRIKAALQFLQDKVRQPLTDYEEKEKARIARIKNTIESLILILPLPSELAKLLEIERRIKEVTIDESFEEQIEVANQTKNTSLAQLTFLISEARKRDADAIELKRLREESNARAQADREEAIRRDAADKAKLESDEKLKKAELQAEIDRKSAEERVKLAVEAEQRRALAEEAKKLEEQQKREKDKKHKNAVHNKILEALKIAGLPDAEADIVLMALAGNFIPNVRINY